MLYLILVEGDKHLYINIIQPERRNIRNVVATDSLAIYQFLLIKGRLLIKILKKHLNLYLLSSVVDVVLLEKDE